MEHNSEMCHNLLDRYKDIELIIYIINNDNRTRLYIYIYMKLYLYIKYLHRIV